MSRDELLFDKIEAYLRGKLPPADAAAFEAEINADPELAELVKIHRLERHGQEWLVERYLVAKMNAWEREAGSVASAPALRATFIRRWWAVGVAAMLVFAIAAWWLLRPQQNVGGPSPIATSPKPAPPTTTPPKPVPRPSQKPPASQPETEEEDRVAETPKSTPAPAPKPPSTPSQAPTVDYPALAAAYYRESDFIQKSGGGDPPGYGPALDSYESGKYGDVEKLLKPVLKLYPNALKTKELLAHSLYKNGRYDAAIPYFRELAGAKDKTIAERSEWALALTLLHKMPAQKSLLNRTLDKITARPEHAFYQQATHLKNEIK